MATGREIVVLALSTVISVAVGTTSTIFVQRTFISRYEESSLIRELIPLLVDEDPRKVDMALLILEGNLDARRYGVIKTIIDRKIQRSAETIIPSVQPAKPHPLKQIEKQKDPRTEELTEYARLRPEWKALIGKGLAKNVAPMSGHDFLDLLERLDSGTSDKTLKQTIELTARKFNNKQYFDAYVGANWLLRRNNDPRAVDLLGLAKTIPNKEDAERILKFAAGNGYDEILAFSQLDMITKLENSGMPYPKTEGEHIDRENHQFLEDLRKENPFDYIVNPPKHVNKFEDVK